MTQQSRLAYCSPLWMSMATYPMADTGAGQNYLHKLKRSAEHALRVCSQVQAWRVCACCGWRGYSEL